MIKSFVLWTSLFLGCPALCSEISEFYVEEGLVSKIFKETSIVSTDDKRNATLVPMIGVLRPNNLSLANKYFLTDYTQLNRMPYLYFLVEKAFSTLAQRDILIGGSIGYGFFQRNISIQDVSGLELNDTVSLQWVPMELLSRYRVTNLIPSLLSVSIDLGLGRLWLHQDGNIDGFDQGFFSSYILAGSTAEFRISESVILLAQVSYSTDAKLNSNFSGWKIGVGAWLSI